MFELSRQFTFEAAHTLHRSPAALDDVEPSLRIHGHSYRAVVTVRGPADPETGMVVDLGILERALRIAQAGLDHRFLDHVPDLGPATMENLAAWVWRKLNPELPQLYKVEIHRDSNRETCVYYGTTGEAF